MTIEKPQISFTERNYGIDLLRIIAMFMVLFLHILGNGGILFELEPLTPCGMAGWFFEMATFPAINCYGIISGFVGVKSKYKYSNLALLWLQVVFYSLGITLFYYLRYPEFVGTEELLSAITPVSSRMYWYVTAYVGMYLFIPIFNNGAEHLTKKQFRATLAALFIALSLLPSVFSEDIFMTGWGYSLLWLSFLYLTGAYIRIYGLFKNDARLALFVYSACTILSWAVKLREEYTSTLGKYAYLASGFTAQYTSPTMLLAGAALFVIFCNMPVKGFWKKAVAIISPCTFGVYIIHTQPYMWERLVNYRYPSFVEHSPAVMMLLVFGTALAIFILLAAVDFVRLKLFKLLHIKALLQRAEQKLLKDLWSA